MRRLLLALLAMFVAVGVIQAGQNPDINIFIEFDNGENRIDPVTNQFFSAYVCFENFGPGGGMTAAEFRFNRTFGGLKLGETNLLGGIDLGDPETGDGWTISAPSCVFPDAGGVVVAAKVDYLFQGPAGIIEVLPHALSGANVNDCFAAVDTWCVRLDPPGHGGVWTDPPPGDCESTDPNPHRFDVPSEYATIQAAINAAAIGDTVYVAAGTYATSTNGETFPIMLREGQTVMSESGALSTTVDAEGQNTVLEAMTLTSPVLLKGFRITGGAAMIRGGGLKCEAVDALTVENCMFNSNSSPTEGGGVYVSSSPVAFRDCAISYNDSYNGAGVYSWSTSGADMPSFEDCTFFDNTAVGDGAAAKLDGFAFPSFDGCTFAGNSAGGNGGALHQPGDVIDCVFWANTAVEGGAVYDAWFIDRCLFWENEATLTGGAVVGGYQLNRSTFVGNIPNVLFCNGDDVAMYSDILAFNGGEPIVPPGGSATLSCSDVYGNAAGDWVGCIAGQLGVSGNISQNPLFCDAEVGDFYLCADSPCAEENNPTCLQIGFYGVGCAGCWTGPVHEVPGEYATIQAAIDAAAPGDTVLVAAGTYATSTNGESFPITLREGQTVMSESGALSTIVDAEGQATVLEALYLTSPVLLNGFKITGGNAMLRGGGLRCESVEALTVLNCAFDSNSSPTEGGGVYVSGSPVGFHNCSITFNESGDGGGVSCWSSAVWEVPSFEDCTISYNTAAGDGGAAKLNGFEFPSFEGCTFAWNTAGGNGGALYEPGDVIDCVFWGNAAIEGGAVYDASFVDRCLFRENVGLATGGAVVGGFQLNRSTFVGNSPNVLDCNGDDVAMYSDIVAFNEGEPIVDSGGSATLACCDVFGNAAGDWVGSISGQNGVTGNISLNPLFCDAEIGDFELCADSPCAEENNPVCLQIGVYGGGCAECWFGPVHEVPAEYATIQAAIDAAAPGDTVLVAAGTYATSTNGESFPITLRDGVLVMSESGAPSTIVDAEDQDTVFRAEGPASPELLQGFTIMRGSGAIEGGGIFCALVEGFTIEDCTFSDNEALLRGGGAYLNYSPVSFRGCTFTGNSAVLEDGGGVYVWADISGTAPDFEDCSFLGNTSGNDGGAACTIGATASWFVRCTFLGNSADRNGGAVDLANNVRDCVFALNTAEYGGALYNPTTVHGCVFWANSATLGGAVTSAFSVSQCTFVGNSPNAIDCGGDDTDIENTIVAFNFGGEPIVCSGGNPTLICCDVYGNAGPDWGECTSGQYGVNGNISVDPLFCDHENGDFTLCVGSSCAEGNNPGCGQIGALGVDCDDCGDATILSVIDVPDDQGRFARVRWAKSPLDTPGNLLAITGYELHRRQDGRARDSEELAASTPVAPPAGSPRMDGWDYVTMIPAHGDSVYQYVSPTLCDSTAESGICWSVFLVRSATDDPFLYFDSPPDSGYSVDNLAPEAPTSLMADGDVGVVALVWDPNEEEDLDYYAVYRDTVEDFVPSEPIGFTTDELFEDTDLPAVPELWYRVTAFDFSGNESEPSASAAATATGVEAEPVPTALVLNGNFPNPFNPSTEIGFGLPTATSVTLTIYGVSGRVVRRLVTGSRMEAGTHAVRWDGRDDAGRVVPSGVYVYTLVADEETLRRRMLLLK